MSKLVIVESPTKAKTISKFLSRDFKVESSFGHIRDLPTSKIGVDVAHDFQPTYVIPTKSQKRADDLKKLASRADVVYFATDEDREGEAIAWHLAHILDVPLKDTQRITFHEITEEAILAALESPRSIDLNLVDAQQARRILDRLVGYELSPFLWKKVARGLSAGRVQSVAVRLVVEREREILAFQPQVYWEITGDFTEPKSKTPLTARLHAIGDTTLDKLDVNSAEMAQGIVDHLEHASFVVGNVSDRTTSRKAPAPFTTSSLQQEANNRLGFSAKQTMTLAQKLYEGIEIDGTSTGLITYMRTDSFNLSSKFVSEAIDYIKQELGDKYADAKKFKTKSKGAQEAHEAIRPTSAWRTPESIKSALDKNQFRLYQLIWQRAVASQMAGAQLKAATIDITASGTPVYSLRATGQTIVFDGFLKIYPTGTKETILPPFTAGMSLDLETINNVEKSTQPPARYSDATLVKSLEERGIGRPSTYAPTIATIIDRGYVERLDDKRLKPTDIALVVNDLLVEHFSEVVDYDFTANMENNLDEIAEGHKAWQPVIAEFYTPFHTNLEAKEKELTKKEITETATDEKCDKCQSPMVEKIGRYGKFLACSNYPECKNTRKLASDGSAKAEPKLLDEKCPECESPLVERTGRYGAFIGCSKYPECKYIKQSPQDDLKLPCPKCQQGAVVTKRSRRGVFYGCNRYPDCDFAFWGKPTGDKCEQCSYPLVESKKGIVCSNKDCTNNKV